MRIETVDCEIREWKIEDKTDLAHNLNNMNILNNLRDGLPFPYTEKDAEEQAHRPVSENERSRENGFFKVEKAFDKFPRTNGLIFQGLPDYLTSISSNRAMWRRWY